MNCSAQVFGQLNNGLISGRLACTSNNPQIFRNTYNNPDYNSKFFKSIYNVFSLKKMEGRENNP